MGKTSIHDLYRQLVDKQIDRRGFVKAAAAIGVSASSVGYFLRASEARAQADPVPQVVEPCTGDGCLFAGQELTAQCIDDSVKLPWEAVRAEFEAATGATLNIIADPIGEAFPRLLDDAASGTNSIDCAMIGMWWLGDLVAGDYILPYDDYYNDTTDKFPKFVFEDELPGMQALRTYDGLKYVIPYDADGQALYYRRDLLTDPANMQAYLDATGNELGVPTTWDELIAIAEFFNGQDLNEDGQPDNGVSMHIKVGGQGMFHFMSLSAPYVIGPQNPKLYWFDPDNMEPLVESPGHLKAMETYLKLTTLGPEAMIGWALGEAWQYFLDGKAVFTYSWGDVAALAVERNSYVKGKIGTVQLPGTLSYTNPKTGEEYVTTEPNYAGNTTGGSWAPVIMKGSEVPELAYYFCALLATEPKQKVYAAIGTDGVDPGRLSQMPPEVVEGGTGDINTYTELGWVAEDALEYVKAYYDNYQNPNQLPFLRIPGTFEYWTQMDVRLSEAVSGGQAPADVLKTMADDFRAFNEEFGVAEQLDVYKKSLGL